MVERVHALGRKQRMPEMTNGPIVAHQPRITLHPSVDNSDSNSVLTQSDHEPPLLYRVLDDFSIQSDHTDITSNQYQGAQIIGAGDDACVESVDADKESEDEL